MLSHGQNTHQTVLDQQSDSIDKTMLETSSPSRDMEEVEEIEEDQASGDGTARHCHTKKSPEQSDDEIKIEYDEEETREELPKKRTRKGRTKVIINKQFCKTVKKITDSFKLMVVVTQNILLLKCIPIRVDFNCWQKCKIK